jgi:PAS domain S-box-containing protein
MCFSPFIHFFASLIYSYLAGFALIKNPKGSLNRACAAFCFSFCLWSFTQIFIQNPSVSLNTVRVAENFSAIGWCSFASFYIWFIFIFTKKNEIIKSNLFRGFLFVLPILFIYVNYAGFLKEYFIKQPWGWVFTWRESIWRYLFYVYYSSFILTGIYLTVNFSKKTKKLIEKKQAKIIYISSIISLILGTLSDALLPELGVNTTPRLGNIAVLGLSFGIVYAITKYKFLIITPTIAAEKIISTMTDALILLDTKGKIITVNNAALNLVGYKRSELKGKSIDMFFTAQNSKHFLVDKIIKGETIRNYEFIFNKKGGENISVLFSTSAIHNEAGDIAGIVFIANDITKHKKAEKELKEIQDKMSRSEKLAALGKLAGMVSHELRNPLCIIKSSVYLLKMRLEISTDEKIKRQLDILDQEVDISDKIINDFLLFSQVKEPHLGNFNIYDIIKESLHEINIPKNIKVSVEVERQLPYVNVDRVQIKIVFYNLILNALQAMPDGGKITLTGSQKDEFLEINIDDTGEGITKENLAKVFDPLFTTKPNGSGLGITVCQTIIEGHLGSIELESKVGKGTKISIKLPIMKKQG